MNKCSTCQTILSGPQDHLCGGEPVDPIKGLAKDIQADMQKHLAGVDTTGFDASNIAGFVSDLGKSGQSSDPNRVNLNTAFGGALAQIASQREIDHAIGDAVALAREKFKGVRHDRSAADLPLNPNATSQEQEASVLAKAIANGPAELQRNLAIIDEQVKENGQHT